MSLEQADRPRAREGILFFLKRHGSAATQTMAEVLGVTPVAIRKHLDALERDGIVEVTAVKRPRGRPVLQYQLTAAADTLFPQGYRQLSIDLIEDLLEIEGPEKLEQLLRLRNERSRRDRIEPFPLSDRGVIVRELARIRNEDGYMVTVEEQTDSYVIREHNCPIYEVAQRFPTACQCEQEFFSDVVKGDVSREESIVEGDTSCTYRVSK